MTDQLRQAIDAFRAEHGRAPRFGELRDWPVENSGTWPKAEGRGRTMTKMYWNGIEIEAQRGTAVVADDPRFPMYWARLDGIVGQRIRVVRVNLDGYIYGRGIDYLDDREGQGWAKVTRGGGPGLGCKIVAVEPGSFRPESDYEPDWYDSHCPTCDAPEPTHAPTCPIQKKRGTRVRAVWEQPGTREHMARTRGRTMIHHRAQWVRPRAYSSSIAEPPRTPRFVMLRSSCGHTLGVGFVWKRQRYIAWRACR